MIDAFYGIHDGVVEVKEGEILDLGRHKLAFATIPMVHWPESMVTYDTTDKVLFSTDAFGGFCALEGGIFDDEPRHEALRGRDAALFREYRRPLLHADAEGHREGPRARPQNHLPPPTARYSAPTRCTSSTSTTNGANRRPTRHSRRLRLDVRQHEADDRRHCARGMRGGRQGRHRTRRLAFEPFLHRPRRMEVPRLVLGSCTYNTELYPPVATLCRTLKNKMMKNRFLGICGSYSWSKGALAELRCSRSRAETGSSSNRRSRSSPARRSRTSSSAASSAGTWRWP